MNELVMIKKTVIGDNEVNAVDARELFKFLGSKQEFSHWIKAKVLCNPFFESGTDYILLDNIIGQEVKQHGGHNKKDYALTLDTAKKVAMAEQTAKGEEVRIYFLKCEKKLKEIITCSKSLNQQIKDDLIAIQGICDFFELPKHLAQIEAVKEIKKSFGVDLSNYLIVAPAQEDIIEEQVYLEPTELGKMFSMTGQKINKLLEEWRLQIKGTLGWKPTEEGKEFSIKHSWIKGSKSGYNLKWSVAKITELLE